MLEKALYGDKRYWSWVIFLLALIGIGSTFYFMQLSQGLKVTGMNRDVSWGFYIAQFTYLVGVAASAVMLVLPYYLHGYKKFKNMIILGEFLAIAAVIMCLGFIVVDLGQPQRLMNVILHPTPNSILFWDMIVLNGYLILNIVIGWTTLQAERKGISPASWVKPLVYLSIFWAFSIHTVTAFLYQGLPGRHYWLTAIMAARFLSSAFCSGPAILLLLALILKRVAKYDPGKEAVQTLAKIITYAMCVNVFFFLLEVFTAFYSNIPGHYTPLVYLFSGLHGQSALVGWMWAAVVFAVVSLVLLIPPRFRNNPELLVLALVFLVMATWIDKGLGLIVGGFIPNPFHGVTEYGPTGPELMIALMIYATGALVLTVLWKVAIGVKKEIGAV
ncbi:sulfate reduction electron transfer complex DsrMKJOP subunit DsrP [Desulfohalobium retbaense]|uniref:Membrane-bound menaquinol oxidoreductase, transmembrane subunit n=1 Tax=Desulfohalobium retbaense (strain ATCC 49708 / DSM 5692 / JCM 16813 / HR100) TaxID=485915 RepID=C8WZR6_DESRD|nr:NrfD/PsrC family molybdoenzyme membrane anchor subunit [Desulfohalobium retbaense]ACV67541.1 membrane-bound menaquinol oxidoreductase, transmembrane subunit [Desulfohalobium retbaense DSM 5692]